MNIKRLIVVLWISLMARIIPTLAQAPSPTPPAAARPMRPRPPTRDPNTPGYVTAKELPDGVNPPPDTDGNFIIGPTHKRALCHRAVENRPEVSDSKPATL